MVRNTSVKSIKFKGLAALSTCRDMPNSLLIIYVRMQSGENCLEKLLKKLNTGLPSAPTTQLLGIFPKRDESIC